MSSNEPVTLREARRVMEVCNACRYCGGFCAVFPAMERRRQFGDGDLIYLANLCHGCAGCFHACQYISPHEFCLNVPRTMAELRVQTYEKVVWPSSVAPLFRRNGLILSCLSVILGLGVVLLTLVLQGGGPLFSAHRGEGAFYSLIPYRVMIAGGLAVCLAVLIVAAIGLGRFLVGMGWKQAAPLRPLHLFLAVRDVLTLRYLGGAGDGCNDVDETFSHQRRWFHQSVLYGFASCLVATTSAAVYDHLLHRPAPYGVFSLPVVTGTVGGLAIMVGTAGLFRLKLLRDRRPTASEQLGMDVVFSAQLFLVSLSGILLLALRGTAAMGVLLSLHLGLVAAFFFSLPYGKFVHGLYRFAALVRYAAESGGGRGEG